MIEALVALVLSSFVLLLVSSTFFVQNNYYASQTQRTRAQDNARVATEMMASEVRLAMGGGFVVAGRRTLTVRSPIVLGVLCDVDAGQNGHIHTEGGQTGLDTDEVAGMALRDPVTGAWTYANAVWSFINDSDTDSAGDCAANGADTLSATSEFHGVDNLDLMFSPSPDEGDVVMLFRETTFKIQTSVMDPNSLGLFRASFGNPLVEFATGMDTTAQFQYRTTGVLTYGDTITAGALPSVDAVRIVADARRPAQTGGRADITFGWSVNVAVRNVR